MALLRWEHQWGGISKKWMERWRQTGKEPPAPFFERPELDPALEATLSAFYDLCTERQIGMSMGPIPLSKVREYAEQEMALAGDAAERFCSIIQRMDGDYQSMISSRKDDGPPLRDVAPVSDPEGTRRVLRNLARTPPAPKPKRLRKSL